MASRCAALNRSLTHIALFPFPAAFGLSGFLLSLQEGLRVGQISEAKFCKGYDDIIEQFRAIRDSPQSVDQHFGGHSFRWWASYSFGQPLEDLLAASLPIFVGVGSLDQPVLTYNTVAEFVNRGRTNLTCKTYVGCDHGLYHGSPEDSKEAPVAAGLVHGYARWKATADGQEQALDDLIGWLGSTE